MLLLLIPRNFFAIWFIHAHPISNFLSIALILIFLMPYHALLLSKKNPTNIYLLIIMGLIAGSTHEQAVAVPVFLLCYYFHLFYRKYTIPKWYWFGILSFCIGLLFVLIPAGNESRIVSYGGGLNWEFMGGTYNWLELGWEKYVYAFIKHFILGSYTKIMAPICILFIYLWIKLWKKNPSDSGLESSLFYFIFSWMLVGVMIASPVFAGGPPDNGSFILYISLMILIYHCLQNYIISQNLGKSISIACLIILLCIGTIQAYVLFPLSIDYRNMRVDLVAQVTSGKKNIIVNMPKQGYFITPFFKIKMMRFEVSPFLLDRYQIESLLVTNKEGESYLVK